MFFLGSRRTALPISALDDGQGLRAARVGNRGHVVRQEYDAAACEDRDGETRGAALSFEHTPGTPRFTRTPPLSLSHRANPQMVPAIFDRMLEQSVLNVGAGLLVGAASGLVLLSTCQSTPRPLPQKPQAPAGHITTTTHACAPHTPPYLGSVC